MRVTKQILKLEFKKLFETGLGDEDFVKTESRWLELGELLESWKRKDKENLISDWHFFGLLFYQKFGRYERMLIHALEITKISPTVENYHRLLLYSGSFAKNPAVFPYSLARLDNLVEYASPLERKKIKGSLSDYRIECSESYPVIKMKIESILLKLEGELTCPQ